MNKSVPQTIYLVKQAPHHNFPLGIVINRCPVNSRSKVVPTIVINSNNYNIWIHTSFSGSRFVPCWLTSLGIWGPHGSRQEYYQHHVEFTMLLSIHDLGVGLNSKQRQRQNTDEFRCKLHLLTLRLINTLYHNTVENKWKQHWSNNAGDKLWRKTL